MKHLGIADKPKEITFGQTRYRLALDPETGYMTGLNTKFTPALKQKFISMAREVFPNISVCCEAVGISRMTLEKHLTLDKKFSEEMVAIRDRSIDNVEQSMFEFSKRPQNFMDRIAILRAYRGSLYNPKSTIVHESTKLQPHEIQQRRANLATVIDAEVLESSAQVLEGEVTGSQVPELSAETPALSPLAGEADKQIRTDDASGFRDPLEGLDD